MVDARPPDNRGTCECEPNWLPVPNPSNCQPLCHVNCETCAGPGQDQCLTCLPGLSMVGEAPGCCQHVCHVSCEECDGPGEGDCKTCKDNAELHFGRCVCRPGYYLNHHEACVDSQSGSLYSDFVLNRCIQTYEHNGVSLVGASFD